MLNLNEQEQAAMKESFMNPTASLSDAWFYATMTGQADIASAMEEKIAEVTDVVESLIESKVISVSDVGDTGYTGLAMQQLAERRKDDHALFAKYLDLTKSRFMVVVADSDANNEMVNNVITSSHAGAAGLESVHNKTMAATKPSSLN